MIAEMSESGSVSTRAVPRMVPARVLNPGNATVSSEDEPFDVIKLKATSRGSRLPLLVAALNSQPETPRPPSSPAPRTSRKLHKDYVLGVQSLIGTLHQVQSRVVAKFLRAWLLKPVLSRFHATEERIRYFQHQAKCMHAFLLIVAVVGKSQTVSGARHFFRCLAVEPKHNNSDVEWESAGEHIQILRDLLATNILTNICDKAQEGALWSGLVAFMRWKAHSDTDVSVPLLRLDELNLDKPSVPVSPIPDVQEVSGRSVADELSDG